MEEREPMSLYVTKEKHLDYDSPIFVTQRSSIPLPDGTMEWTEQIGYHLGNFYVIYLDGDEITRSKDPKDILDDLENIIVKSREAVDSLQRLIRS